MIVRFSLKEPNSIRFALSRAVFGLINKEKGQIENKIALLGSIEALAAYIETKFILKELDVLEIKCDVANSGLKNIQVDLYRKENSFSLSELKLTAEALAKLIEVVPE